MKMYWDCRRRTFSLEGLAKQRTYHCLHHEDSLFSQFNDILVNIDGLLCLDPLQHAVQGDESASPAHTSTTVHQQQILPGVGVCLSHSLDEVDHGDGIGRYSMIRPGKIMILGYFKGWSVWFLTLKGNVKENEEHADTNRVTLRGGALILVLYSRKKY